MLRRDAATTAAWPWTGSIRCWCYLPPANICRSIWMCCTSGLRGNRPPAWQALAPDHVVWTPRSRRGHYMTSCSVTSCSVRRFTHGEEHDATGHVALTLLNCKVTAQVEVIRSC